MRRRALKRTQRNAGGLWILRTFGALGLYVSAAVALPNSANAAARPLDLRTIVTFDRALGETPENLVVEPDGTIYVSLAFAGEIRRVSPDGAQATVSIPTGGGLTVGIAQDLRVGSDLDVAVKSADASDAGIWRVPPAAFSSPSVQPTRIEALPTSSFPNGIQFDNHGNLFITDSNLGIIWRLAAGSTDPDIWAQSPLLQPTGAAFMGFPLPGANGLYLRHKVVLVSNTAKDTILEIRIRNDGSAGAITVRYTINAPDDLAVAPDGTLYVAQNVPSELSQITPGGTITTLASASDGFANTSSARFGTGPGRQILMYVTNSAYFTGTPSVMVATIHSDGEHLASAP